MILRGGGLCLLMALAGAVLAANDTRETAVALGLEIDRSRAAGLDAARIEVLLGDVEALRSAAQEQRIAREAAAGEDEAALERLFRSPEWSQTGFALAAARYWRSWLLLERYGLTGAAADLEAARHGFQTTLALIVYPGLVRGSWLGLGYVAVASAATEEAAAWFGRVAKGDGELADVARRELELLAALEPMPPSVAGAAMSVAEADALERDVVALLERHGRTLDGARAAADRLRRLEAGGQLTVARVERLLDLRDALLGQDIGPVAALVSAEDALDHGQYYTAVQKYRAFFAALEPGRRLEFSEFRERYAEALIASGMPEAALVELGRDGVAAPALTQLARAMLYASSGSDEARAALVSASADLDNDAARFTRALLQGQPSRAPREADSWYARLPAFELCYRELLVHANDESLAPRYAALGLALLDALPRETRRQPWLEVARLDMEGHLQKDVARYLADLEALRTRLAEAGDPAADDAVIALELRYLMRHDGTRLVETLEKLEPPLRERTKTEMLTGLMRCDVEPWCLAATERLIDLLADDRDNALHARLRRLTLLADAGALDEVYHGARTLIDDYPDSGSAWERYASAARAVGRHEDADRALARIAGSLPVGSRRWRETQLTRLGVRLDAGAIDAACALGRSLRADAVARRAAIELLAARNAGCEG